MDHGELLATLPTEQRLAMAYAPAGSRAACLALLALDARLAGLIRTTREPMLGQIQLAWWREQILADPAKRPHGEPLLTLLGRWRQPKDGLIALIDGWELLLGLDRWERHPIKALAEARGDAWAALANDSCTQCEEVRAAGQAWALADLAIRCSNPDDRAIVLDLLQACGWQGRRLPRTVRPLAVLYGLARRSEGRGAFLSDPLAMLAAIRLGLIGS